MNRNPSRRRTAKAGDPEEPASINYRDFSEAFRRLQARRPEAYPLTALQKIRRREAARKAK